MEGPGGGTSARGHQHQQAQASPTPSPEQVLAGFNKLRQEQRGMAGKGAELEQEVAEHGLVIDTLAEVNPDRRCFRMVGGVLVERTVREVLPALESNKQQLLKLIDSLNTQMQLKGRELTEYREKYNIRLMSEDEKAARDGDSRSRSGGTGVLVS
ncbi:prefoldin subunit 2 [Hemiscyllium ocellatum]|uniref:prefoldin subunit 2 n=1 Tax=Hemiscyllium ocellatum TaxID=170820 RepID=UPI002966EFDA|nr:prefoldin subunit 2 [Hemiscyllium ocellatum]